MLLKMQETQVCSAFVFHDRGDTDAACCCIIGNVVREQQALSLEKSRSNRDEHRLEDERNERINRKLIVKKHRPGH